MNADRFKALADAYGADLRRWPASERGTAESLIATDRAEAERLLFDPRQTDAALQSSVSPLVSMALRDRVIASAAAAGLEAKRQGRFVLDRLAVIFGAGWAAAACAGVIAGVGITSHLTAYEQADAILYQATFSGVDDVEVLG